MRRLGIIVSLYVEESESEKRDRTERAGCTGAVLRVLHLLHCLTIKEYFVYTILVYFC